MSFKLATMDVGLTPPIEYMAMKTGESAVLGEALAASADGLTKCGPTTRPDYVAVGPDLAGIAPVVKVQDYMVFGTTLSADGAALTVGTKVTLEADGLQVTATTESGVAAIVAMEGTDAGSAVQVRF